MSVRGGRPASSGRRVTGPLPPAWPLPLPPDAAGRWCAVCSRAWRDGALVQAGRELAAADLPLQLCG